MTTPVPTADSAEEPELPLPVVRVPDPRPAPLQLTPMPVTALDRQPVLPGPDVDTHEAAVQNPLDGSQWAGALVRALAETFSGRRAPAQLARWTAEEVLGEIHLHARRPRPLSVRGWRAQSPRRGVLEVSAHLSDGRRSRALALRIEAAEPGRWLCTALRVG